MKGIFPIDKFRTLQTPFYYYDTKVLRDTLSVSYTHLDVYKRQQQALSRIRKRIF